jgi:hypothetical protein
VIVPQLRPGIERPTNSGRELQHAHVRIRWFQDRSPVDELVLVPGTLILTAKRCDSGKNSGGGHVERREGSVELEFERPLGAGNAGALARMSARGERVFFDGLACLRSAGEGARVPINT